MIKDTDQNKYGPASNFLLFNWNRLLIFRFWLFHNLDIKWVYFDSNSRADRNHVCTMYKPVKVICGNFHLIVNAFEDQVCHDSLEKSFFWFYKINIFGRITASTGLFFPNPTSTHGKLTPRIFYQFIFDHDSRKILLSPMKSATNAFSGSL